MSSFEHYDIIRSSSRLVECRAKFVVRYGQTSRGFLAVQGHQRCQGLLSKREKAPNLDRMICNKKNPLVFAKKKVFASRELRFGMVTLELENTNDA